MIWPVHLFYAFIVALIRIYKWVEFQILKLFNPLIKRKGKELALSMGVVFHCPEDGEKLSAEDQQLLLERNKKYEKVIHIKVNDNLFFARVANIGSLGLGEAYMDKTWELMGSEEDISELIERLFQTKLFNLYYNWWNTTLEWLELYAFNLQTIQRAFQVGTAHYDLGKFRIIK